jgi:cytoskeletal protein RodZ
MSENLQYRLYNASIPPPGDAWGKIAEELDKESEHRLSLKLQEATLTPPAAAWQNILEVLNEAAPGEATVVPIRRKWTNTAAAAVLIGLIILGGLYYFMWSDRYNNNTASNQTLPSQNNSVSNNNSPTKQPPVTEYTSPNAQTAGADVANLPVARPIAVASMGFSPRIRYSRVKTTAVTSNGASQANVDEAIGDQVSLQPEANIPPQQYLTVAAPNGEPAKISTRFIDAVTYVLIDAPTDNMNSALKSLSWKQRVSKWRNKLMMNAAFIPAGTNFLDIIELEKLLNE